MPIVGAERWLRKIASALLTAMLVVATSELACWVWVDFITHTGWLPRYAQRSGEIAPPWLIEDNPWGVWHFPNAVSWQRKSCFSVALQANSVGARDRERALGGDPHRTIVLGDSFAEGVGVEAAERVSDLLERKLNREFLNFGTTNDFGPLQYQIVYEMLASRFSHDQVLILFLPDNDFTDNDKDYWRRYRPDFDRRYRPYYQAAEGGYVPYYPVPNPKSAGSGTAKPSFLLSMRDTIADNSWTVSVYRSIIAAVPRMLGYSGYFDFSDAQLKAVLWSFAQIKRLAGQRNVTIAIIPRPADFARVAAEGRNRLGDIMKQFGAENGIDIVDLLPLMLAIEPKIDRYFHPCDGHWNALGNQVAAQALAARLRY